MPTWAKILLSCLGTFLIPFGAYYESHQGPGVLVTTVQFWISAAMSGVVPLGTYFVGLSQRAPWDPPKP